MSIEDYRKALKDGKKEYQFRMQLGITPTLKSLDSILPSEETQGQETLGLVQIPMDQIAGTKYEGRCISFAANFMPIMDENSEFASKWANLSTAAQVEGIHDAVVAVEYLNEFYIVEGNKRVSVMKYNGAAEIPGTVTRILPKKTDEKRIKIYYEFVDFYRVTRLHNVIFSEEGRYAKLLEVMGKSDKELWTDDERKNFGSVFFTFSEAVRKQNGGVLKKATPSDAFLSFLSIYKYDDVLKMSKDAVADLVAKSWKEIALLEEDNEVELKMDPTDATKPLLNKLIPMGKKSHKAAFIYAKTPSTSSWTYAHELGRWHVEEAFNNELTTVSFENADENNIEEILCKAIADDCDIIFTTSPVFTEASVRVAIDHPEIKIFNCSLNTSHKYIRNYYTRMYEAKFVLGAIAGAMAWNDKIVYIADYPLFGTISHINAFALGARMINPRAKVYLEWSTLRGVDVDERMKEINPAVASGRDMYIPENGGLHFGLFAVDGEHVRNIAMPVYHWGKFYEQLIKGIIDGTWKQDDTSARAVNYWWGMSAGVIDVFCSHRVPVGTERLVHLLKKTIRNGEFKLFAGRLYSQNGLVHDSKEEMTPEEIMSMDWLAQNVIGRIPGMEELIDEARPVMEKQGITEAK